MPITRVGVLRGGPSSEYEVSLKTGDAVLHNLPKDKYRVADILITKNGEWHLNGYPTTPAKLAHQIDVAFNAMHGEFGEDGQVQNLLDQHRIRYTGARSVPSSIAMNKGLTKQAFEFHGIRTPKYRVIRKDDDILNAAIHIFEDLDAPFVVKPVSAGSSVGVAQVQGYKELLHAINMVLEKHEAAIVEEYIRGREIACGVVDLHEEGVHALNPIEILIPNNEAIWGYESKYNGKSQEVCPAEIDDEISKRIQSLAMAAHDAIGLRHYSRTDFIVNREGIWVLEINSLPGLTDKSLLPQSLGSSGIGLPYFLDYIISLALSEK